MGDPAAMAAMLRALTGIAAHQLKAEQSITAKELRSLVTSLAAVVNDCVDDATVRERIRRGWLALIGGAVE
jgi:hypothetical protein